MGFAGSYGTALLPKKIRERKRKRKKDQIERRQEGKEGGPGITSRIQQVRYPSPETPKDER